MKKYLFFIGLFFFIPASVFADNPSIKATLNKKEVKSNEDFSVSYTLLTPKKRRNSTASGSVILNRYSDSSCSLNETPVGSPVSVSGASASGSYNVSSAGTYYLKPALTGHDSSCIGPVTIIDNNFSFQNLSLTNVAQVGSSVRLSLKWEDNSDPRNVAASASDKASLSFYSNSSCLTKIRRSRIYSISPKNGSATFSLTRKSSPFYVKAVSAGNSSSCVEILILSCQGIIRILWIL